MYPHQITELKAELVALRQTSVAAQELGTTLVVPEDKQLPEPATELEKPVKPVGNGPEDEPKQHVDTSTSVTISQLYENWAPVKSTEEEEPLGETEEALGPEETKATEEEKIEEEVLPEKQGTGEVQEEEAGVEPVKEEKEVGSETEQNGKLTVENVPVARHYYPLTLLQILTP